LCCFSAGAPPTAHHFSQALSEPVPKGNKIATYLAKPYLQVNTAELTGWLDDYIWSYLFGATFNPLDGENWRVLLLQPVVDHITKVFAVALLESEQKHTTGQTEVHLRRLSEVPRLMMRESHSVEVSKCIYTRQAESRAGLVRAHQRADCRATWWPAMALRVAGRKRGL
jgi:type III restriction enzyme